MVDHERAKQKRDLKPPEGRKLADMKILILVGALFTIAAHAHEGPLSLPACARGEDGNIPLDTAKVRYLKTHTENGYRDNVYVRGQLLKVYDLASFDKRFQIRIGPNQSDTLEIYYRGDRRLPVLRRVLSEHV